MTRFRRHASAGTIEPRSGAIPRPRARPSSFARFLGAAGMVSITLVLFWLLTDDDFRVSGASVRFDGLRYADEAVVRGHLAELDREPNVFRVRAADIVSTVSVMPDVDAAAATVTLPAEVSVRLEEREPLFIWTDNTVEWLVDENGMLFGPRGSPTADAAGDSAAADDPAADDPAADRGTTVDEGAAADEPDAGAIAVPRDLPRVLDERIPADTPTVGSMLPEDDMRIMRHLLALTPELLGSSAKNLELRIDESLGYELRGGRWRAIFGRYSPRVQPPEDIPRQVQCLRAVLAEHERKLEVVRLSLSETSCGTFK